MSKTNKKTTSIKTEGNYIDKIIKENCRELVPFFFKRICNLEWDKIETLPEIKQQVTNEKEPDFLRLLYNQEFPRGVIIHLEFETTSNSAMLKRMLEYTSMLYMNYEKPILQYVLYLGRGKSGIENRLHWRTFDRTFEVINIEDFDYRDFLSSDYPEEVILSFLTAHDDISLEKLLELIVGQLVKLQGSKGSAKFINQLIMLSRFRKLHVQTIKKLKRMKDTAFFDVNTDILYLEGKEEGIEVGIEKGLAVGLEKGLEEGLEKGIVKGLERGATKKAIIGIENFIELDAKEEMIVKVLEVKPSFVKQIKKDLSKKDKIVKALKGKNPDAEKIAKKLKVHPLLVEVISDDLKKEK